MKVSHHFDTYDEVLDFLYTQLPMFQRVGASAYKKDLTNTLALCKALGNPERDFRSIHIAGTNGKGSCSHYLASILQEAGYKTGLYTSPHLKNFTERIKLNGFEIPQSFVLNFVNKHKELIEELKPSFFEITVVMAFDFFAKEKVDIAVIEVGMGGRLDSTNVVIPEVSLITNISMDHQQWLGNTLQDIAQEKGGIIKPDVPVVISEWQEETYPVFEKIGKEKKSEIHYAVDNYYCINEGEFEIYRHSGEHYASFPGGLMPDYQLKNIPAVCSVIELLNQKEFIISKGKVINGILNMPKNTGLKGRWQLLQQKPKIFCDVGHNEAGVSFIVNQLNKEKFNKLHMVWGTVNDKDITKVLQLLPKEATYYFCQANIPRAMGVNELAKAAANIGLHGRSYQTVKEAIEAAKASALSEDLIFIGGSTFVVAEIEEL